MELKVLIDNKVGFGKYYLAEAGLSYCIEDRDAKILFDLGYSGLFIKNANLMNVDLNEITHVCFSHGHNDHTGGLYSWIREFEINLSQNRPQIIAHEGVFKRKIIQYPNEIESGIALDLDFIRTFFDIKLVKDPVFVTENLVFLGQIERTNDFENKNPIGKTYDTSGNFINDYCLDDSALIYNSTEGIVVITGCSHSGICNIVQYALKIAKDYWNQTHISAIIGGIHLLNPRKDLLEKTIDFLKKQNIDSFYLGHCIDFESKAVMLNSGLNIKEIEVGKSFKW